MFHDAYPFRTSSSTRMAQHFRDTADDLIDRAARPDPFVVEIGSNDGTMLARLAQRGVRHLGIDPAANMVAESVARGVNARAAWFDSNTAGEIRANFGRADVVYAANTLCHIPALDEVFTGLDLLLSDDGLIVFEDPYLGDVLRLGSFDQIYDEHFYLFSATSVRHLAQRHGFTLTDVEHLDVHGGEQRYTLSRGGTPSAAVRDLVAAEARYEMHSPTRLRRFGAEIARRRDDLREVLVAEQHSGRTIAGYGATAKSATVLNYCGIGPGLLPIIHDTTPEKQGRLTPGSHIPVVPFPTEQDARPDTYLLLAWNHTEEILAKEREFCDRGGRWIRYVPDVVVEQGQHD